MKGKMTDIEKLTDEERRDLVELGAHPTCAKALRIIDAQASALAEARAEYTKRLEAWEEDRRALLSQLSEARAECERLRAELAIRESQWREASRKYGDRAHERLTAAESRLAVANALLARGPGFMRAGDDWPSWCAEVRAHLAGQEPVAGRTEAEQRVLDACEAWHVLEIGPREDGSRTTVYGDPLPVARAELARRELKST